MKTKNHQIFGREFNRKMGIYVYTSLYVKKMKIFYELEQIVIKITILLLLAKECITVIWLIYK